MSQNYQQSTLVFDQMIRKENHYMNGIRENHDIAMGLANRLRKGNHLEELLPEAEMMEYRERLKHLSEKNVLHERKVSAFLSTLRNLRSSQEPVEDYQGVLQSKMEQEMQATNRNSVEVHQETNFLKICEELGESTNAKQDDELEVLQASGTVNLKCPLSGTWLEIPVRNKVCGHVYSKQHILHHIQSNKRNCKCPQVGCLNQNVTAAQLEDDKAIERLVKRELIRQEKERVQQSQHAMDLEEEEEF
jgi:hypothetical protein